MKMYHLFLKWFDEFIEKDEFNMASIKEGSPYHREESVLVHTKMVVSCYLNSYNTVTKTTSEKNWIIGAFSCAFHDIGKPVCFEHKVTKDGFKYTSSENHETASGSRWVEYYFKNKERLEKDFDMTYIDMYNIWVIIANHLPYNLGDVKINMIKSHLSYYNLEDVFINVCIADSHGRIADDFYKQSIGLNSFINKFNKNLKEIKKQHVNADTHLLVGCPAAGKSTFSKELEKTLDNVIMHSMDSLRLDWYSSDPREAFTLSCEDKTFADKVNKDYQQKASKYKNVIVDNTNLSMKRRKFYCNGYSTIYILFEDYDIINQRDKNRGNKRVGFTTINRMYNTMTPVLLGEAEKIYFYYKGIKYIISEKPKQYKLLK